MISLGTKIKQLRTEQSVTQAELASVVGVSVQAVSKWECGGTPDISLLPAIAQFFGISIDELFGNNHIEDSNVDSIVMKLMQATPEPQRMRRATELCWAIFKGISGIPNVSGIPLADAQAPEDNACTRGVLRFDTGFAYFNARRDSPSMLLIPEPDYGYNQILASAEEFTDLFAKLSDPVFFETVVFLYMRRAIPFSLEHACAALEVDAPQMMVILKELFKLGWIDEETVEIEEGPIPVYRPILNDAFVAFLYFGTEILQRFKLWYLCNTKRSKPLLKHRKRTIAPSTKS